MMFLLLGEFGGHGVFMLRANWGKHISFSFGLFPIGSRQSGSTVLQCGMYKFTTTAGQALCILVALLEQDIR